MNMSINPVSMYARQTSTTNRVKQNKHDIAFQGAISNKTINYAGSFLAGLAMFAAISCTSSKTKPQTDTDSVSVDNTEILDTTAFSTDEADNKRVITNYHYFPTDNGISGDNYAWIEKNYPDGRVEIDSMGYKILKTPDGERITSKVEKNDNGDVVVNTLYPDGSFGIRVENGINYKDTIFWANGNVKRIKNKEVVIERAKSPTDDSERIVNQTYKVYDDNGVLLYWEKVDSNEIIDENNFKYDDLGRIIDNGFMKYEYEGDSEIPILVIDELEGCKYIIEYDTDGTVKNQYFKASNGVVTPYSQIYEINW